MKNTTQSEFGAKVRGELRYQEPMQRHTSWRAGGCAQRAYVPADLAESSQFLRSHPQDELIHVLGLGSNILVRDGGLRGTVILLHRALNNMRLTTGPDGEPALYVQAGVAAPSVAQFAAKHHFDGAEFLAGIPATIGGALAMNAGCYGAEIWDSVITVTTIDRDGMLHERSAHDYEIGYRAVQLRPSAILGVGSATPDVRVSTQFPTQQEWFVAARFGFRAGEVDAAEQKIKELLDRRQASQPLSQPNAGSVFRNPIGNHAARLIEACGLPGLTIGDAQVSTKHANFIVNLGAATAFDIEALIEKVQRVVKAQQGITLEREVRIVGKLA